MRSAALREAEEFKARCIAYDTPRLESEVFPEGVSVTSDIQYMDDGAPEHLLDVYSTSSAPVSEAYLLIHGGAFVYGNKELDKNFGMRLALASGIPVVNINYTLLPSCDLAGQFSDIDAARDYARKVLGFSNLHYVGDSAGGYHAMAAAIRDKSSLSASLICGAYENDEDVFPGALFGSISESDYDLHLSASELFGKKIAIITGEGDFLREDNRRLATFYGDRCVFYDPDNTDGREMVHVFPIAHPEWPEGVKMIEIIASFARSGG